MTTDGKKKSLLPRSFVSLPLPPLCQKKPRDSLPPRQIKERKVPPQIFFSEAPGMVPSGERRRIRSAAVDGGNQGRGTNKIPNIGPSFLWQAEGGKKGDGWCFATEGEKRGREKCPRNDKNCTVGQGGKGGKRRKKLDRCIVSAEERGKGHIMGLELSFSLQ